jgi:hypothetical protein
MAMSDHLVFFGELDHHRTENRHVSPCRTIRPAVGV